MALSGRSWQGSEYGYALRRGRYRPLRLPVVRVFGGDRSAIIANGGGILG